MAHEPVIKVRDLVVGFGDQLVLDHLSLDVRGGEILGVVGASGAGKSVLLRTIIGLLPKRHGTIEVLGVDLDRANEQQRRARVVPVVHPRLLRPGLEVREHAVEQDAARGRDRIMLVEPARLRLVEGVGERVPPLLVGEADRLVAIGGVLEHRERRADLGQRRRPHALGRSRADGDAGSTEAVVEEDLGERAAGRVTDDDRRGGE